MSVRGTATFSSCERYRYTLTRAWHGADAADAACPQFIVIGLNPSTATAVEDDPTIRRCLGFARRENFRVFTMLNLFALRSTDPAALEEALRTGGDPIGPENNDAIVRAGYKAHPSSVIVCAWGVHGKLADRGMHVAEILRKGATCRVACLGLTREGAPRHPLYLRADTPLVDVPR